MFLSKFRRIMSKMRRIAGTGTLREGLQEAETVYRTYKKILCILLIVMLLGSASASSVKVNANTKFYRSASKSSDSVSISKGTKVELSGTDDGWAKVKWKGVTGYVQTKYLNATKRVSAYVNKNTYLYAKASHSSSKKAVKANTKVYVVGTDGDWSRVQNSSGSVTCYIETKYLSSHQVSVEETSTSSDSGSKSSDTSWKSKVVKMNWFDGGSSVLKKGHYGYIYDIDTGLTVHIKRMGGTSHADCEPATKTDTAKLKKIAGGSFSWDSQAVILYADGKFVACAINTKPHGDQTISSNGYDGQFCLHMVGSKTHGTDTVNEEHQKSINRAYNWAH